MNDQILIATIETQFAVIKESQETAENYTRLPELLNS
jgi:hypothetical protein